VGVQVPHVRRIVYGEEGEKMRKKRYYAWEDAPTGKRLRVFNTWWYRNRFVRANPLHRESAERTAADVKAAIKAAKGE
jgi:hypothetical protein